MKEVEKCLSTAESLISMETFVISKVLSFRSIPLELRMPSLVLLMRTREDAKDCTASVASSKSSVNAMLHIELKI